PVASPPCWPAHALYLATPVTSRSARHRPSAGAVPDAPAPTRPPAASRAGVASRSCRCHTPSRWAATPRHSPPLPADATCQDKVDARQHLAIVEAWASTIWLGRLRGQQRCDDRPQLVADQRFAHASRLSPVSLGALSLAFNSSDGPIGN